MKRKRIEWSDIRHLLIDSKLSIHDSAIGFIDYTELDHGSWFNFGISESKKKLFQASADQLCGLEQKFDPSLIWFDYSTYIYRTARGNISTDAKSRP